MALGIKINLGASVNTVTVDGHTFDRMAMESPEQNKLRRLVVSAWRKQGENR